jgi:nicotinamide phosphoribosyltransferase
MTTTAASAASRLGTPTKPSVIAGLLATDGYKHSHRQVYPQGTNTILINWTNRSGKLLPGATHAVHFGLQAFLQNYLIEMWAPFFAATEDEVADEFERVLLSYFGPNNVGSDHVRALHRLGYLPLHVKGLPEGTLAPFGVPTVLVENTHPEFFWLPNYIETALSASIWHPSTTATVATIYRELLEGWAEKTGGDLDAIDFQAHDFSMRGQTSLESAAASGAGHLLSFLGTDSMPSLDFIDRYYPGDNGWVGASVPATEHSVMCIRGEQGEFDTFNAILDAFPTGIVSAVADGYDFFGVLTEILPQLKGRILARDGKLVIRPDSGDPVDIMTGTYIVDDSNRADYEAKKAAGALTPEELGAIEILGDLFGWELNDKNYKRLNQHIGLIYGDSITLDRAQRTFERLAAKGWESTSVVLGIGSFTYQYLTRDNLGSAVKATWADVDGQSVDIQKDPKTGAGKKSARGRLAVIRDETGELELIQQATPEDEARSLIQTVWRDGEFINPVSFADVRANLKGARADRAARADHRAESA